MMRRFVNLVTLNWAERVYSVRRMNPYKELFYESAKAAIEAADEANIKEPFPALQTLQLPNPAMNFTATDSGGTLDMFSLFSPRATSEGRIVYANAMGEAGLYDADKHVHSTLGVFNVPKGTRPMCLSTAPHPGANQDSMYVLDMFPGKADSRCFEVLESVSSGRRDLSNFKSTWRWRLLPPPPFVSKPGYQPSSITAYTAVDDGKGCSTIYVSCGGGIGTYRFETARHDPSCRQGWSPSEEWSYVGAWKLPFVGRAQYVSEFNLWFGFLEFGPNHLCAVDLSAIDSERPPTVLQNWQDLNPPEGQEWLPTYLKLVHLGDGKFLTAKIFELGETCEQFAVLTGIEMIAGDQSLKMVKHKCAHYGFGNESIEWVL
ncbi:uncharacterized protein [Lolium perenne]|uniref:uncharacterized protein n=1 Tax=Lolium perenne TaxID=4522 RepID=UPI0021EAD8F7